MKKLIFFLLLLIGFPLVMFGQDPLPPSGWGDIIMNPEQWFLSLGAIAALTAFLAAFLNGLLKVASKALKQVVAWLVAIILMVVSNLLNFGYGAEFPIFLSILHGFGAGLIANGVFDIPVIKAILDTVEGWFKPKEG